MQLSIYKAIGNPLTYLSLIHIYMRCERVGLSDMLFLHPVKNPIVVVFGNIGDIFCYHACERLRSASVLFCKHEQKMCIRDSGYTCKITATYKCMITDICHGIRNSYAFKTVAVGKSGFADTCNRIGNCYIFKAAAFAECTVALSLIHI